MGHPKIITENFDVMDDKNMPYEGLVKCRILPPKTLLHPVLPHRCNNKLVFPLCATCANACQTEPCEHADNERALEGAWVTLELKKALELGYRLLDVFEVRKLTEFGFSFLIAIFRFGILKKQNNTIHKPIQMEASSRHISMNF